jgi:hypothetical protein
MGGRGGEEGESKDDIHEASANPATGHHPILMTTMDKQLTDCAILPPIPWQGDEQPRQ